MSALGWEILCIFAFPYIRRPCGLTISCLICGDLVCLPMSNICCRLVDPVIFGDYPDIVKKNVGKRLPAFTEYESKQIKGSVDFIGVNHYTTVHIKDKPSILKMNNRDFYDDMAVKIICMTTIFH